MRTSPEPSPEWIAKMVTSIQRSPIPIEGEQDLGRGREATVINHAALRERLAKPER